MTNILLISNKEDDLTSISTLLDKFVSDCLVITARSGLQGIEKAKNEMPAVILLDIELPEMDGYEVCNRLKSDEKTKHVPIIMITEIKSNSIRCEERIEAGVDSVLKKPFDEVELTALINMALRIHDAEKEKAKLKNQLQQARKMEAMGTLAGGIAHEFNNMLFPIIGYAEMSMYDLTEHNRVKDNLKKILKAANRAKNLVQQVLDYSRQDDQERKPLKIQYIIKETLKLTRAWFPATIEIRQNIDNACGPVIASPSEIQQLIMDLCTHAHHAMKEKGGVLEVTLSEVDIDSDESHSKTDLNKGAYLQLSVSHKGRGIEHKDMEHNLDAHITLHDQGNGTGTGLYGADEILHIYKGNISIHSDPVNGTTVRVYLPLTDTGLDEIPQISAEQHFPMGNESVLLIDDEEDVLVMMHSMIEKLGYQVTSRNSSIEALDTFRNQPRQFDLVITDQTMPEMTGLELSEQLIRIRPDIPVILCTGYMEMTAEDNTGSPGIGAYVMKPVRIADISVKIRKLLDQK
ncbi:MAG: response regulator [Desulfobacterales bacterium]|jgi:CheY-like chemotaxis protein